jgi:hypothetical protein
MATEHKKAEPKVWRSFSGEAYVMLAIAGFFAVIAAAYWFTSHEHAGSVMLLFTVFLGLIPGSYLLWWGFNMPPRPEDRDAGTHADAAGTVGAFPSSSIWPFVFGMSAALIALAFVFGPWLAVFGSAGMAAGVVGYSVESRRGGHI